MKSRIRAVRVLRIVAVLGLWAAARPALAQKTDLIVLKNADQLHCELKSYSAGKLTVDTDASGFITVKWNKIESITSTKLVDIETIHGNHVYGSLAPSDPPGKLVVVGAEDKIELDFLEVFNITPVHQSFWRRFDGNFDLGFNYTQSSKLTQFDINSQATYRVRDYELVTDISAFFSRQEGVTAADRFSISERYDHFLGNRWLASGGVGFERNTQLGLNLRVSAAAGGGRNFVQTNQTTLTGFLALSGNHEQPVSGEGKYNVEAVVGGRYNYFMYDFPKVNLSASVAVYPSLTTGGRVRLEASGSAKREIVSDLYISIAIFDSFDSRDPTSGSPATTGARRSPSAGCSRLRLCRCSNVERGTSNAARFEPIAPAAPARG